MTTELRNLRITKIALVRKGYRPVNDGARITVVKAEEDSTDPKNPTLAERLAKAIAGVLGSESAPPADEKPTGEPKPAAETVEKAKTATQIVTDHGTHGQMSGMHAHDHSHVGGDGKVYTHSHEHNHSGDDNHYHQYDSPEHGQGSSMMKAEAADAAIDAKITKLIDRMDKLVADLKTAQDKDNAIEKAIPTADSLQSLVDAGVATALEPVVKAIEDLGLEIARRPKTPNADGPIDPTSAKPAGDSRAVEKMSFSEAVRYLTNR